MLAFYRKYRPRLLSDLIGQEEVVGILKNAARSDKISHAYLFYGSRGTGKTTAARLIAKIINCLTRNRDQNFRSRGEPCNQCVPCQEIDAGQALDIIEIDAASNRGIEEIRSLKEGIRLSPTRLFKKVFIIDEAHMLTKEAFNALLKTLEEPPAHAAFILATTERDKIPATIASRTQRFHFKKLPIPQITTKLKKIASAENLKASSEVLELIAASAEGSLRDAESLLDQMNSFAGNLNNLPEVERLLGQVGHLHTIKLADHIIKKDLSGSLAYLAKLDDGGYNLVQLNKDLIHYLRRTLSLKLSPELINNFQNSLSSDELQNLKKHSLMIDEIKHVELLKSLIRAYSEMRYTPLTIVPLEIAIIENLK